ncbi:MAG: cupredoxin domain-containing protein [Thermodesulfobacteriota bacterium]
MKIIYSAVLIFLLAGFFSSYSYSQETQIIEVVLDSYKFVPEKIVVEVNKPVELKLKSITSVIPHNITIDDPESGLVFSEDVKAGKEGIINFTPTKTGTYEFYCNKKNIFADHRKKGMIGTLEVVEKK